MILSYILLSLGIIISFLKINLGLILISIGLLIILLLKNKDFSNKIKYENAKKEYNKIKYDNPTSSKTLELAKIIDFSANSNTHVTWLREAIEFLEKEYRISKSKMFVYNRNKSAANYPYIIINPKNKNNKMSENYERLFFKNKNYEKICFFLNKRPINSLNEELSIFCKLIEKKESKS